MAAPAEGRVAMDTIMCQVSPLWARAVDTSWSPPHAPPPLQDATLTVPGHLRPTKAVDGPGSVKRAAEVLCAVHDASAGGASDIPDLLAVQMVRQCDFPGLDSACVKHWCAGRAHRQTRQKQKQQQQQQHAAAAAAATVAAAPLTGQAPPQAGHSFDLTVIQSVLSPPVSSSSPPAPPPPVCGYGGLLATPLPHRGIQTLQTTLQHTATAYPHETVPPPPASVPASIGSAAPTPTVSAAPTPTDMFELHSSVGRSHLSRLMKAAWLHPSIPSPHNKQAPTSIPPRSRCTCKQAKARCSCGFHWPSNTKQAGAGAAAAAATAAASLPSVSVPQSPAVQISLSLSQALSLGLKAGDQPSNAAAQAHNATAPAERRAATEAASFNAQELLMQHIRHGKGNLSPSVSTGVGNTMASPAHALASPAHTASSLMTDLNGGNKPSDQGGLAKLVTSGGLDHLLRTDRANITGYKGVTPNHDRYQARCQASPCRNNNLGNFGTPAEAAQAYLQHQEKEHPEGGGGTKRKKAADPPALLESNNLELPSPEVSAGRFMANLQHVGLFFHAHFETLPMLMAVLDDIGNNVTTHGCITPCVSDVTDAICHHFVCALLSSPVADNDLTILSSHMVLIAAKFRIRLGPTAADGGGLLCASGSLIHDIAIVALNLRKSDGGLRSVLAHVLDRWPGIGNGPPLPPLWEPPPQEKSLAAVPAQMIGGMARLHADGLPNREGPCQWCSSQISAGFGSRHAQVCPQNPENNNNNNNSGNNGKRMKECPHCSVQIDSHLNDYKTHVNQCEAGLKPAVAQSSAPLRLIRSKSNRSGFKGVLLNGDGQFQAKCVVPPCQSNCLGRFDTAEEAAEVFLQHWTLVHPAKPRVQLNSRPVKQNNELPQTESGKLERTPMQLNSQEQNWPANCDNLNLSAGPTLTNVLGGEIGYVGQPQIATHCPPATQVGAGNGLLRLPPTLALAHIAVLEGHGRLHECLNLCLYLTLGGLKPAPGGAHAPSVPFREATLINCVSLMIRIKRYWMILELLFVAQHPEGVPPFRVDEEPLNFGGGVSGNPSAVITRLSANCLVRIGNMCSEALDFEMSVKAMESAVQHQAGGGGGGGGGLQEQDDVATLPRAPDPEGTACFADHDTLRTVVMQTSLLAMQRTRQQQQEEQRQHPSGDQATAVAPSAIHGSCQLLLRSALVEIQTDSLKKPSKPHDDDDPLADDVNGSTNAKPNTLDAATVKFSEGRALCELCKCSFSTLGQMRTHERTSDSHADNLLRREWLDAKRAGWPLSVKAGGAGGEGAGEGAGGVGGLGEAAGDKEERPRGYMTSSRDRIRVYDHLEADQQDKRQEPAMLWKQALKNQVPTKQKCVSVAMSMSEWPASPGPLFRTQPQRTTDLEGEGEGEESCNSAGSSEHRQIDPHYVSPEDRYLVALLLHGLDPYTPSAARPPPKMQPRNHHHGASPPLSAPPFDPVSAGQRTIAELSLLLAHAVLKHLNSCWPDVADTADITPGPAPSPEKPAVPPAAVVSDASNKMAVDDPSAIAGPEDEEASSGGDDADGMIVIDDEDDDIVVDDRRMRDAGGTQVIRSIKDRHLRSLGSATAPLVVPQGEPAETVPTGPSRPAAESPLVELDAASRQSVVMHLQVIQHAALFAFFVQSQQGMSLLNDGLMQFYAKHLNPAMKRFGFYSSSGRGGGGGGGSGGGGCGSGGVGRRHHDKRSAEEPGAEDGEPGGPCKRHKTGDSSPSHTQLANDAMHEDGGSKEADAAGDYNASQQNNHPPQPPSPAPASCGPVPSGIELPFVGLGNLNPDTANTGSWDSLLLECHVALSRLTCSPPCPHPDQVPLPAFVATADLLVGRPWRLVQRAALSHTREAMPISLRFEYMSIEGLWDDVVDMVSSSIESGFCATILQPPSSDEAADHHGMTPAAYRALRWQSLQLYYVRAAALLPLPVPGLVSCAGLRELLYCEDSVKYCEWVREAACTVMDQLAQRRAYPMGRLESCSDIPVFHYLLRIACESCHVGVADIYIDPSASHTGAGAAAGAQPRKAGTGRLRVEVRERLDKLAVRLHSIWRSSWSRDKPVDDSIAAQHEMRLHQFWLHLYDTTVRRCLDRSEQIYLQFMRGIYQPALPNLHPRPTFQHAAKTLLPNAVFSIDPTVANRMQPNGDTTDDALLYSLQEQQLRLMHLVQESVLVNNSTFGAGPSYTTGPAPATACVNAYSSCAAETMN